MNYGNKNLERNKVQNGQKGMKELPSAKLRMNGRIGDGRTARAASTLFRLHHSHRKMAKFSLQIFIKQTLRVLRRANK